MKKSIFYGLMRHVKSNPGLMKKLKVFIVVGLVGFVLTGALVVWAAVAAINVAGDMAQDVNVSEQIETVKTELNEIPALVAVGCLEKSKSLLNTAVWLENPIGDNLQTLKQACWPEAPDQG